MNENLIKSSYHQLQSRISKLGDSKIIFLKLCEEYKSKLKLENTLRTLEAYLSNWFLSYLAFQDEIMILIQGAVHRIYHQQEHKEFIHERNADSRTGSEARFYSGFKFLSCCSVDGIRYTCNNTSSFKGMNKILDQVDDYNRYLSDISKDIDVTFTSSVTEVMNKININNTIKISCKYRSEYIEWRHYPDSIKSNNTTSGTNMILLKSSSSNNHYEVITISRQNSQRRISKQKLKQEALSTAIEDIIDDNRTTTNTTSSSNTINGYNTNMDSLDRSMTTNTRIKNKNRTIIDDDDDDDENENMNMNNKNSRPRLHSDTGGEVLDLGFGLDERLTSLDQIKRQAGASIHMLANAEREKLLIELNNGDCNYFQDDNGTNHIVEKNIHINNTTITTSTRSIMNNTATNTHHQNTEDMTHLNTLQPNTHLSTYDENVNPVYPLMSGIPTMTIMTLRLITKNIPTYMTKCSYRMKHKAIHIPSVITLDIVWNPWECVVGKTTPDSTPSYLLSIPISYLFHHILIHNMKAVFMTQYTHDVTTHLHSSLSSSSSSSSSSLVPTVNTNNNQNNCVQEHMKELSVDNIRMKIQATELYQLSLQNQYTCTCATCHSFMIPTQLMTKNGQLYTYHDTLLIRPKLNKYHHQQQQRQQQLHIHNHNILYEKTYEIIYQEEDNRFIYSYLHHLTSSITNISLSTYITYQLQVYMDAMTRHGNSINETNDVIDIFNMEEFNQVYSESMGDIIPCMKQILSVYTQLCTLLTQYPPLEEDSQYQQSTYTISDDPITDFSHSNNGQKISDICHLFLLYLDLKSDVIKETTMPLLDSLIYGIKPYMNKIFYTENKSIISKYSIRLCVDTR